MTTTDHVHDTSRSSSPRLPTPDEVRNARRVLAGCVAAAAATGAFPVPAASAGVVAENAVMIAVLSSRLGRRVTVTDVLTSIGAVGAVNAVGRALFIEGARALAWGAGPFGLAPVCVLGATTAAVQTWIVGEIVIAIAVNGGVLPSRAEVERLTGAAPGAVKDILSKGGARGGGRQRRRRGKRGGSSESR